MSDYHVLLVISREPFDKSAVETLKKQDQVRHFIQVEVDMQSRNRGLFIRQPAPEYMKGDKMLICGLGDSASVTITDWLKYLCSQMSYEPEYKKREKEKEGNDEI